MIPTFVKEGKLLEIGCASGGRLLFLRNLGWKQLYGIELVKEAAQKASAEGLNVVNGQVENTLSQYPDSYFDVIISSMVIEHLYNPFQITHLIATKLKPGGQFLFSTVVRDSLDAKIFRDYWSGFDFPRHMVYFKKSDLFGMLKNQFEIIQFFHQNAPIDFVRPAISRKEEGKGSIKDTLILALARSPFSTYIGLILAWMKLTCRVSIHCKKRK
jgi:SAM-dependent methyltransferase